MEKLRETILKMSNKEPNVPLSKTQNSILQQHLNRFLSGLHTTPVHPPYTCMIEKALQELDEEGGSNEDSISEFIKKEYDSLPRAHTTLLKHHLKKISEKGEILMIDGGRFLLPGDSKNLNSKRKMNRKRRRNSSIKQKKPQQKKKKEEDPRHEVHFEQCHRRPAKYKEDGAKIDDNTISAAATNKEVLCLDAPQDEVRVKEPKDKRRGRALKGKEDGMIQILHF
ncbi:uncharacterized protein LOC129870439 [Solanum dulcamara]|uniref:uncharacterized protein LOC129870439 n=1 Tax=Solanum dulcamara TaxID=45834 RepID=UPI002485ED1D|nr:uncharacterized protein LOC129870439 [Solanum dulcamara]